MKKLYSIGIAGALALLPAEMYAQPASGVRVVEMPRDATPTAAGSKSGGKPKARSAGAQIAPKAKKGSAAPVVRCVYQSGKGAFNSAGKLNRNRFYCLEDRVAGLAPTVTELNVGVEYLMGSDYVTDEMKALLGNEFQQLHGADMDLKSEGKNLLQDYVQLGRSATETYVPLGKSATETGADKEVVELSTAVTTTNQKILNIATLLDVYAKDRPAFQAKLGALQERLTEYSAKHTAHTEEFTKWRALLRDNLYRKPRKEDEEKQFVGETVTALVNAGVLDERVKYLINENVPNLINENVPKSPWRITAMAGVGSDSMSSAYLQAAVEGCYVVGSEALCVVGSGFYGAETKTNNTSAPIVATKKVGPNGEYIHSSTITSQEAATVALRGAIAARLGVKLIEGVELGFSAVDYEGSQSKVVTTRNTVALLNSNGKEVGTPGTIEDVITANESVRDYGLHADVRSQLGKGWGVSLQAGYKFKAKTPVGALSLTYTF